MNCFTKLSAQRTLLGAFGILTLAPMSVAAQENTGVMEEIVVQAPITVERESSADVADPTSRTESVTLKRQVYLADLDLTKYQDVKKLEARIRNVAEESCGLLDDMFPRADSRSRDTQRCVKGAIASASAAVERAIAAASQESE
jgi:UrcA family protein